VSDEMVVGHGRGCGCSCDKHPRDLFTPEARDDRAIHVWAWDDAPGGLKALSRHGGDEDWVVHMPVYHVERGTYAPFLEIGAPGSIGCCDVSEHLLSDGSKVYIGAHA
jgi:hypothetical protein